MNVLHYSLGLPPLRSGGLVNYSVSLSQGQCEWGARVSFLYPGDYNCRSFSYIVPKKSFNHFRVYEIKNPVLVPLLHGIRESAYIFQHKRIDRKALKTFFDEVKPEVFHIHTFMGLDPEILCYAVSQGIKVVYTTHDYFGLCPRVNFIDCKGRLCDGSLSCAACNAGASDKKILYFRNNSLVLKYKSFFRKLKDIKAREESAGDKDEVPEGNETRTEEFEKLSLHYRQMFSRVDLFHYNSSVTQSLFSRLLPGITGQVKWITHEGITDKRECTCISDRTLKFGYIGSLDPYKGFPVLFRVLKRLFDGGMKNWELTIYGNSTQLENVLPNVRSAGYYSREKQEAVFRNMDLLIVPSVCYETFGLVVLEAISYGVPVLVSDHVGSKDIVSTYDKDFIFSGENELYYKLGNILKFPDMLSTFNHAICRLPFPYTMKNHVKEIFELYSAIG